MDGQKRINCVQCGVTFSSIEADEHYKTHLVGTHKMDKGPALDEYVRSSGEPLKRTKADPLAD